MSRNKYPEQTRKKILEMAFNLFGEKGYEDVVMQDIIDVTGFSRGAVYHHFKNKNEIMQAVISELYEQDMLFFNEMTQLDIDAKTRFNKLVEYIVTNETKREMAYGMWVHKNNILLYSNVTNTLQFAAPAIAEIIKQGISEGIFDTMYPNEAAEIIMLLFNIWLDPTIYFKTTAEEIAKRFEFLLDTLNKIGVPLFSDESAEKLKKYYLSFVSQ